VVKHRSAARGEPPSIRVKRLLTVFCATAGRAPYVPHPMAKSGHERSQAGMCCHGQRNLSTAHFRRSQAGLPAQRWWSGAGSNCRPSAFQKVCHRPWDICRKKLDRPSGQHTGLSGTYGSSLAGVPTCAGECRFVRVTGVLAIRDARTCVALVLTSQNRLPSTRAPPAQAPPSPAAYDAQPQHPPPWPTRLPEPATRRLTHSDERNRRQQARSYRSPIRRAGLMCQSPR